VGQLRNGAAGPGEDAVRAALLLDLTSVDLRTLRAMDDPELIAAVDRMLAESSGLRNVWYANPDPDDLVSEQRTGHAFSAGRGQPVQGEDTGG
jgi:hypothetical protein